MSGNMENKNYLIGLMCGEDDDAVAMHLWFNYAFAMLDMEPGDGIEFAAIYNLVKDTDDVVVSGVKTDAECDYLRSLGGIIVRGRGVEPKRLYRWLGQMIRANV